MVIAVMLLKHGIAGVFFVTDGFSNTLCAPFPAERTSKASVVQVPADGTEALSSNDAEEYFPDNRRGFFINLDAVLRNTVSEHEPPIKKLSIFKTLSNAPFLVFTCRQAFFLRIGCENGKHQLALGAYCVDVLFFKKYVHLHGFQLTNGFKQCYRIPSEAGDGLGKYHIHLSGTAICEQPLKTIAVFFRAGQRLVGVNAHINPAGVPLYQITVIADLRRQRV
ncbi:hypothetical protein SDC9_103094 [bioreactor metagenome]|uniref:Uncharacterized protein n=1 Tax=bioreactor metagenome TaxID=1076179 RepID=A0A645ASQ0_9ZZZZ